ncbi:flavodoxin family protein [Vibrio nereis]|uniref:flavodoxin family protein n=1 Tax=Vibrio nereis TaxID=693 RepID=UPI00249527C4|nr:NAD(P)H-dependent oxidoreductase [Vibrio nereis]
MNVAVIWGTSKSDGNTRKLADSFVEQSGAKLFDLSNFNVSFYDYSHENKNDDFLPIIHELLSFDHLVFASPVYWYSMSAQLKVFFDRLSDLLTIEKGLGHRLKGKSISVLSTGYNLELPDCFVQPFELTAKYMQLEFQGCEYLAIQTESDLGKVTVSGAQAIENVT